MTQPHGVQLGGLLLDVEASGGPDPTIDGARAVEVAVDAAGRLGHPATEVVVDTFARLNAKDLLTYVPQLASKGRVDWGWLGVAIAEVTEDDIGRLKLREPRGVLVRSVMPGEPADKGGVRADDVTVEGFDIDGRGGEGVELGLEGHHGPLDLAADLEQRLADDEAVEQQLQRLDPKYKVKHLDALRELPLRAADGTIVPDRP